MPKLLNDKVKAIGAQVKISANASLLDSAVRHAVILERYKKHEVKQIVDFLDGEVVPELIAVAQKKLAKNAGAYSARKVAEATFATNELLRGAMRVAGEKVGKNLGNLAIEEGRWHVATLKKSVPLGVDMNLPAPELLRELIDKKHMGAAPLKGWFAKLGDDAANGVAKQIRVGTAMGESVDDIVKRLVGDPAAMGAFAGEMGKIKRDASSVVRTAVNHASAQAREASYAANADVIKGVQIVATLDERTTEICMGYDGKVYPINEGPRPPFHFNCRTTTAPVTKSWKEMQAEAESANDKAKLEVLKDVPEGSRASMKGEVPAAETYGTWLAKQPEAFQDDMLGKAKAALFRSGKVPIDRFVDASGKSLTLEQLTQALADAGGALKPVPAAVLPAAGAGPVPTAPAGLPGQGAKAPKAPKPKPKAPPPPEALPKPSPALPKPEVPASPPKAPDAPSSVPPSSQEVVDAGQMVKVGDQKGSNPGGTYQDPIDGSKWYVKTPANPEQARNEVLAARLYELAGVKVPRVKLATLDGKVGVASRIVDGLEKASPAALRKAGAHKAFAVDAWLANWDVVGMGYDNMLLDPAGTIMRVDTGGALRFRAKGGLKGSLFGEKVGEFETFLSAKNPQSAAVFSNMDDATLLESMKKVTSIPDAKIKELVDRFGPMDAHQSDELLETILLRKKDVAKRQAALEAKIAQAAAAPAPPPPPSVPPPPQEAPKGLKAPKVAVKAVAAPTATVDVKAEIMSNVKAANAGDIEAAQELVNLTNKSPQLFSDAAKTKKQALKVLDFYEKNAPLGAISNHSPGFTTPDGQPLPRTILNYIKRSAPQTVGAARRFSSPDDEAYVQAYAKFKQWANDSTKVGTAIARWKDGWYTQIREFLVFAKTSNRQAAVERTIEALIEMGNAAPSAERVVYRGMRIGSSNMNVWDALLKNDHFAFNSWASASKSRSIAEGFAGSNKRVIFTIKSKTGIDIETLKGGMEREREVLVRAGSHFKIKGRVVKGDTMEVELEELL